jgi:hypothetical protein
MDKTGGIILNFATGVADSTPRFPGDREVYISTGLAAYFAAWIYKYIPTY